MSATLTADVISTTYKKILFQKDDNKLYYTNSGGTADVEMTTLASPMTLSGLITASAGIKLGNNIIYSQNGTTSITTTNTTGDVTIAGDLTVTGNDIKSSSATAITMAGTNVTVVGDLTITGGNITNAITCDSSLTTTGLFTANANVVVGADADGTDRSITFGHTTLKSIIGIDDDQDVFAINTDGAFEAANDFELDTNGNATIKGDLTISGGNITNGLTLDSTLDVGGNTTITGNLTFTGARDILFTESDGLEIRDEDSLYVSMISNTMAITPPTTFAGKVLLNGNSGPTAGTGITDATGEVHKSWVERYGNVIKTSILIDVTGLRHSAAADIIGNDGTSNPCHIGQITTALNGTIFSGRMTCLEQPTVQDMDLYAATEGTGIENAAISTLTEKQVINGGDQSLGTTTIFDNGNLPAGNDYLYLVCQSSGDADYSAGKFLIELWGTV